MMTTINPAAVSLHLIARIEAIVAAPISLGHLAGFERRMIPIMGGKIKFQDFEGNILPGGSDVQSVRDDGTIDLLARYAIDLGEYGNLLVENTGIRRPAAPGEAAGALYFCGTLRFSAPPGALQWLNDSVFISSAFREKNTVHIDVMKVIAGKI